MNNKKRSILCYIAAVLALAIGASFHGFRANPASPAMFRVGVAMGVLMITLCVAAAVAGTVFLRKAKKEK